MYRECLLAVASRSAVRRFVLRHAALLGVDRFVGGSSVAAAVAVARRLNRQGVGATFDVLGEDVRDPEAAERVRETYLALLDAAAAAGVDAHVSVKPSAVGAALSAATAYEHLERIVARAQARDTYVRLDMEHSALTDVTLELFRALDDRFPGRVGTVLQAYLHRTPADLERLSDRPRRFRIVKGAYREPPTVALRRRRDIADAFWRLATGALAAGHHVAVATHDVALRERVLAWIRLRDCPRDRYEWQTLYGVGYAELLRLAWAGEPCRIYVPFGEDWYGYVVRRLAERPENLALVLRAWVRG
ncbi:MAG: proline dehydrogenase family protein [Actinomycetia bacterium]|nr:proline dehydrogenase family protein [Actinomycetes bacterium]